MFFLGFIVGVIVALTVPQVPVIFEKIKAWFKGQVDMPDE
jgi:hypothetical protein